MHSIYTVYSTLETISWNAKYVRVFEWTYLLLGSLAHYVVSYDDDVS